MTADIKDQEAIESSEKKSVKINTIAFYFRKIMKTLELNLDDPSLRDTPERVAKMYVNEVYKYLDDTNFLKISFFWNVNK